MPIRNASIQDLQSAMGRAGVAVVDVRSVMEFRSEHIDGAVNVPLQKLATLPVPEAEELWVICRSGNRSASASQALDERGLNVVNVQGGMIAWQKAKLPVLQTASFPWMALIFALALGTAPITEGPHLLQKIGRLTSGQPLAAIDWFDLVMHGAPMLYLAFALVRWRRTRQA